MTITHTEIRGSGEGRDSNNRDGNGVLKYSVRGSNDLASVQAYVIAEALFPELVVFGGREMVYKDANWTNPAFGKWEFTGQYQEPDIAAKERRLDIGEGKLSFDTGGDNTTVYVGHSTAKFPSEAPDLKNLIGVKDSLSDPEGVQILIPSLKFNISFRKARADVDAAYVKKLAELTGTTNDDSFYGFAAEELLFLGASGQLSTITDPEITFSFAASANLTDLTIGDITGISKKGHDYLWVRSSIEKADETSTIESVPRPKAVYVSKVYKPADWTELGIGTDA